MDLSKTAPTQQRRVQEHVSSHPHTYSPFNHFLSIHTNLVEFRFCRLLLKEGFIAGRREQGEDAGRWELCLAGGCTRDVPSPGSCPATPPKSLTFSPKNKGWKTPGVTHGTVTVAQGRAFQWQSNRGTGDNSHLLSIQLDPCSSSGSKHYPRATCACPHTTSTQFPAGRTWTVTQFPAGRTRTVQDSTQFPAGRTWTAQTLCNSQLEGLELYWTLCIYQHQRQWPTSSKPNDWEEKGNHLTPKEEGSPASPPMRAGVGAHSCLSSRTLPVRAHCWAAAPFVICTSAFTGKE